MPLASLRSGATQADCGIDHNLNIDDIQNTVIVQIVDRRFSAAIHIWKYPLAFRAMKMAADFVHGMCSRL